MSIVAEVIAAILVALLLAVSAFALLVGILGSVFGEGFARCARCGHFTLGSAGHLHPHGCPRTFHQHLTHVVRVTDAAFRTVHLRHN